MQKHGKKPSRIFDDQEDEALNSLNQSLIERFNNTNQYLNYDIEADMNKIHKKTVDKGQFKELSYNHQVIGYKMRNSSASETQSEKAEKARAKRQQQRQAQLDQSGTLQQPGPHKDSLSNLEFVRIIQTRESLDRERMQNLAMSKTAKSKFYSLPKSNNEEVVKPYKMIHGKKN